MENFKKGLLIVVFVVIVVFAIIRLDSIFGVNLSFNKNENNKDDVVDIKDISDNPQLASAYQNLLKNGGEFGDVSYARYYIHDIDRDGIEEIIILSGTSEEDAQLSVYSFLNNEVVNLGSIEGEPWLVCKSTKGKELIVHYVTNEIESITELKINNNQIQEKIISSKHNFSKYSHNGDCDPLVSFAITDMNVFSKTAGENPDTNKNIIPVNSPEIGSPMKKTLEYYKYNGDVLFNVDSIYYAHKNPEYKFNNAGDIKYYWDSGLNKGYISKDGIIVDVRAFVTSGNVYQLLHALGYKELLEYEPKIIPYKSDWNGGFLQWEIEDAFISIEVSYLSKDWKSSRISGYCIYSK